MLGAIFSAFSGGTFGPKTQGAPAAGNGHCWEPSTQPGVPGVQSQTTLGTQVRRNAQSPFTALKSKACVVIQIRKADATLLLSMILNSFFNRAAKHNCWGFRVARESAEDCATKREPVGYASHAARTLHLKLI
mmetsp:Transcript_32281/g.76094  ORF Transcript_32281/g.76094 Transcript_32281/m.76094 type:complete len:133 (-) Transcript_32281:75-473(-)